MVKILIIGCPSGLGTLTAKEHFRQKHTIILHA